MLNRLFMTTWYVLVLSWSFIIALQAADVEPKILYDFEADGIAELAYLRTVTEGGELDIVQDYGVTRGQNCLRLFGLMGQPWTAVTIKDPAKLKDAEKYDYLAVDIFSENEVEIPITFELWDDKTVDYFTRCSFEGNKLHPGKNRLFVKINRAKRNRDEGREFEELTVKDRIDRAKLTAIKIFFAPLKSGGPTRLWLDNLRLLPESAVNDSLTIKLPASAIAYKFGPKAYAPAGFKPIFLTENVPGMPKGAKGVVGAGITEIGTDWPDTLTGNGLYCAQGGYSVEVEAPAGDYHVWVSAGRIFNRELLTIPFQLKVGPTVLVDERLSERDFYGEKGIFRYLRTQYSERPQAMWLDYVEPEAQEFTTRATVSNGTLRLKVSGMRLSALVLVPAADEAAFKEVCASIRGTRQKNFADKTFVKKQDKPARPAGAGAYTVWYPEVTEPTRPWSGPTAQQAKVGECRWAGAQGERLTQRVCVTAWEDLGMGDIKISDLAGPGRIPAANIRTYYQNYRFADGTVGEMGLMPWTRIRFEPQITWAYWMWVRIPDDAPAGEYTGTITFTPDKGGQKQIPLKLTVHPFKLRDDLPLSLGMYYGAWSFNLNELPEGFKTLDDFILKLSKEQFQFMREIGFTSTSLPAPFVYDGNLRTEKALPVWKAAKEAGLGAHPGQKIMTQQLGLARRIGRDLFYDGKEHGYDFVDRHPGVEWTHPRFGIEFRAILQQYKKWIDAQGLPVAMEAIDEPREVPNPWNRRRDETIRYGEVLTEAGFDPFVTFMGDVNNGVDYTPIVEAVNIVSVHPWKGCARLIDKAREEKKELWIYNGGMDRYSWGFYNWRMGSTGRWEWHFSFYDGGDSIRHPNNLEWYSPFTSPQAFANYAPFWDYPGGMTFRSEFFTVADGIVDAKYIHTLERAIADNPGKAALGQKARDFLASVKKTIPQYSDIRGMESPDASALVGKGLDTPVAAMTDAWRARIAALLTEFAKP